MKWKDKSVLVTGGAGFIGSCLSKELVNLGCDVCVADNFFRGRIENIKPILDKIKLFEVDLTKQESCLDVTKDIDYVFHLAASVGGIHYINKQYVEGGTPSILMNTNMIEAAAINNIERFLFTSSACVYCQSDMNLNKFKEEYAYPANPTTTYGWAKICGEVLCKAYHSEYGMKTCSMRIFNAYGENENIDPRSSHVIPSLIRKAVLYPKEGFKMFGDGEQVRAFMYVKDCVKGLILGMEKNVNGEAINLGSEELISIKDLAEKIVDISGKDIKIGYDLSGPRGTNKYCADTTKLKEVFGWCPDTPLDEGLRNTYDYINGELK